MPQRLLTRITLFKLHTHLLTKIVSAKILLGIWIAVERERIRSAARKTLDDTFVGKLDNAVTDGRGLETLEGHEVDTKTSDVRRSHRRAGHVALRKCVS